MRVRANRSIQESEEIVSILGAAVPFAAVVRDDAGSAKVVAYATKKTTQALDAQACEFRISDGALWLLIAVPHKIPLPMCMDALNSTDERSGNRGKDVRCVALSDTTGFRLDNIAFPWETILPCEAPPLFVSAFPRHTDNEQRYGGAHDVKDIFSFVIDVVFEAMQNHEIASRSAAFLLYLLRLASDSQKTKLARTLERTPLIKDGKGPGTYSSPTTYPVTREFLDVLRTCRVNIGDEEQVWRNGTQMLRCVHNTLQTFLPPSELNEPLALIRSEKVPAGQVEYSGPECRIPVTEIPKGLWVSVISRLFKVHDEKNMPAVHAITAIVLANMQQSPQSFDIGAIEQNVRKVWEVIFSPTTKRPEEPQHRSPSHLAAMREHRPDASARAQESYPLKSYLGWKDAPSPPEEDLRNLRLRHQPRPKKARNDQSDPDPTPPHEQTALHIIIWRVLVGMRTDSNSDVNRDIINEVVTLFVTDMRSGELADIFKENGIVAGDKELDLSSLLKKYTGDEDDGWEDMVTWALDRFRDCFGRWHREEVSLVKLQKYFSNLHVMFAGEVLDDGPTFRVSGLNDPSQTASFFAWVAGMPRFIAYFISDKVVPHCSKLMIDGTDCYAQCSEACSEWLENFSVFTQTARATGNASFAERLSAPFEASSVGLSSALRHRQRRSAGAVARKMDSDPGPAPEIHQTALHIIIWGALVAAWTDDDSSVRRNIINEVVALFVTDTEVGELAGIFENYGIVAGDKELDLSNLLEMYPGDEEDEPEHAIMWALGKFQDCFEPTHQREVSLQKLQKFLHNLHIVFVGGKLDDGPMFHVRGLNDPGQTADFFRWVEGFPRFIAYFISDKIARHCADHSFDPSDYYAKGKRACSEWLRHFTDFAQTSKSAGNASFKERLNSGPFESSTGKISQMLQTTTRGPPPAKPHGDVKSMELVESSDESVHSEFLLDQPRHDDGTISLDSDGEFDDGFEAASQKTRKAQSPVAGIHPSPSRPRHLSAKKPARAGGYPQVEETETRDSSYENEETEMSGAPHGIEEYRSLLDAPDSVDGPVIVDSQSESVAHFTASRKPAYAAESAIKREPHQEDSQVAVGPRFADTADMPDSPPHATGPAKPLYLKGIVELIAFYVFRDVVTTDAAVADIPDFDTWNTKWASSDSPLFMRVRNASYKSSFGFEDRPKNELAKGSLSKEERRFVDELDNVLRKVRVYDFDAVSESLWEKVASWLGIEGAPAHATSMLMGYIERLRELFTGVKVTTKTFFDSRNLLNPELTEILRQIPIFLYKHVVSDARKRALRPDELQTEDARAFARLRELCRAHVQHWFAVRGIPPNTAPTRTPFQVSGTYGAGMSLDRELLGDFFNTTTSSSSART
jgi:hypothetical protein